MIVKVLQFNKLGSDNGSIQLHVVVMVEIHYVTSCVCVCNGLVLVAMEQIHYVTRLILVAMEQIRYVTSCVCVKIMDWFQQQWSKYITQLDTVHVI